MKCCFCRSTIVRNLDILEVLGIKRIAESELCKECCQLFQQLPEEPACQTCQKSQSSTGICEDCRYWKEQYPDYDFCHRAFFQYDKAMQDWMYQYKFMGDIALAATFSREWKMLTKRFPSFLVCPIPLSIERQKLRGFNQVSQMLDASEVSYHLLLERSANHLPQAQKTRQERLEMTQIFRFCGKKEDVKDQKILLVDDVYTTGRTLFHAASALFPLKPQIIRTFSLAR
jgi:competence protein ComFC